MQEANMQEANMQETTAPIRTNLLHPDGSVPGNRQQFALQWADLLKLLQQAVREPGLILLALLFPWRHP